MNDSKLIKCDHVNYRKGYIEIVPKIHKGCINIESWDIDTDYDISNIDIYDNQFPTDKVLANTEIELTIAQAEELINNLKWAIKKSQNQ
jgi:hypothetical protein